MDPKQIRYAVLTLIIVPFFVGVAVGQAMGQMHLTTLFCH